MSERTKLALLYGVGTAAVALGTMKGPFDLPQWAGLVGLCLLSTYGKYTSSTSAGVSLTAPFLDPDRKVWTETQRRDQQGLPPKAPTV